jgi:hypothetical protein
VRQSTPDRESQQVRQRHPDQDLDQRTGHSGPEECDTQGAEPKQQVQPPEDDEPVEDRRTGEKQAESNRENEPPA